MGFGRFTTKPHVLAWLVSFFVCSLLNFFLKLHHALRIILSGCNLFVFSLTKSDFLFIPLAMAVVTTMPPFDHVWCMVSLFNFPILKGESLRNFIVSFWRKSERYFMNSEQGLWLHQMDTCTTHCAICCAAYALCAMYVCVCVWVFSEISWMWNFICGNFIFQFHKFEWLWLLMLLLLSRINSKFLCTKTKHSNGVKYICDSHEIDQKQKK